MLISNSTGTAISITNSLNADGSGAFRPNFDATHIGTVGVATNDSGTSSITSNAGTGGYSGAIIVQSAKTGATSNTNTADLAVQITLTSSQLQVGTEAILSVTHGLASRLDNQSAGKHFGPGQLQAITDRFRKSDEDAHAATLQEAKGMDDRRAALVRQFANLELGFCKLRFGVGEMGDLASNRLVF